MGPGGVREEPEAHMAVERAAPGRAAGLCWRQGRGKGPQTVNGHGPGQEGAGLSIWWPVKAWAVVLGEPQTQLWCPHYSGSERRH